MTINMFTVLVLYTCTLYLIKCYKCTSMKSAIYRYKTINAFELSLSETHELDIGFRQCLTVFFFSCIKHNYVCVKMFVSFLLVVLFDNQTSIAYYEMYLCSFDILHGSMPFYNTDNSFLWNESRFFLTGLDIQLNLS